MADNVDITPGAGATIAADDVAGVQFQKMKVDVGGNGVSAPLVQGQQTMANSLSVAVASDQDLLEPNSAQADQALTVDATAGGVQFSAFHADTTQVFWSSESAQCRVTFDGSAPTTTNGHLIEDGSSGIWSKALATAAKFIRTGAVSVTISASQLKG